MEKQNRDLTETKNRCGCAPCTCEAKVLRSEPAARGCGCGCDGGPCACGEACPSQSRCGC